MVSFANFTEYLDAESSDDEEVSVINTFVHVGPRRKRSTASAGKSRHTAPDRILIAAAEVALGYSDAAHIRDTQLEVDEQGDVDFTRNYQGCQSKTMDHFETSSTAESQSNEDEKLTDKSKMHPQAENRRLLELSDLIHDSRKEQPSYSAALQAPRASIHVVPVPMSMVLVPSILLQSSNTSTISSSPEGLRQVGLKTITRKNLGGVVGPARLDKEVTDGGMESVRWIVDGRKLESNCNQLLSREFELDVPGAGPQPFKLMLHATASKARGGSKGFRKASGRSLLFLKCEASLPSTAGCLAVQVIVGRELATELSSSPIRHHFLDQNCCPIQQEGDWNLLKVVDRASKYFEIFLQVLEH